MSRSYINQLGVSVMMPIILTIIGSIQFERLPSGGLDRESVLLGWICYWTMGENQHQQFNRWLSARTGTFYSRYRLVWRRVSDCLGTATIGLSSSSSPSDWSLILSCCSQIQQTLDVDIWNYRHCIYRFPDLCWPEICFTEWSQRSSPWSSLAVIVVTIRRQKVRGDPLECWSIHSPWFYSGICTARLQIVVDKITIVSPRSKNINVDIENYAKRFGVPGEPMPGEQSQVSSSQ